MSAKATISYKFTLNGEEYGNSYKKSKDYENLTLQEVQAMADNMVKTFKELEKENG